MSIDLTLDHIITLTSYLEKPWYTRPTCHVAGTNGKGSVTALLSSIFNASGLRVGCFNSPHLISIYDCILIDNKSISTEKYDEARQIVNSANARSGADASSFEILTVTALVAFERAKVDIAVVEVGMGGRLDATNVIPENCVLVSALTAVDLDHQAFLGTTVAEIAKEKAGIARHATPFVLGKQKHEEVVMAVKDCVQEDYLVIAQAVQKLQVAPNEIDAPMFSPKMQLALSQNVRFSLPCFPGDTISAVLPLHGAHQLDNLGLAVSVISALLQDPVNSRLVPGLGGISPHAVARGVESTKWRGRLSFHIFNSLPTPLSILADGAHNPASAATLGNFIEFLLHFQGEASHKLSLTYILALSHSPPKTPLETLAPLFSLSIVNHPSLQGDIRVALVRFTAPEAMPWVKSVPPSEMRTVVSQLGISNTAIWAANDNDTADKQLMDALGWASSSADTDVDRSEELVVVAGSLYLVADLYRLRNLK